MVNKTHAKRKRDIKTKLMAAICMLLVSSIMMVSTTYAWFTLSTAPEVTGINTSVGANGNLEMALMPVTGITASGAAQNFGITSGTSDSTKALNERNVTWGNLVDLNYAVNNKNYYGLDDITLYPAELNAVQEDAAKNPQKLGTDSLLKTPAYGSDGRVSELKKNTDTSIYNSADQNFPRQGGHGVRAVGVASGMTDRELAYRSARANASTAASQAKTLASQSLNTNGSALADIALAHGVNASATHTQADVTALLAIVSDLLGTDDKTGILEYIEDAYRSYIIALGASGASGMTDDQFKAFQTAVNGATTVYDVEAAIQSLEAGATLNAELKAFLAVLKTTKENVTAAQTELQALVGTGDAIPWSDNGETQGISDPLYKLAKTEAMKINGYPAGEVKANMSAIVNSVSAQGLNVVIATGGGVYADIADHCGDYSASIVIKKVEYNGLVLENMTAKMATDTIIDDTIQNTTVPYQYGDVYLDVMSVAAITAGAPSAEGGQTMPLSDMYGYIIDLAFRTNAADSNLLLQSDAADRIYSEDGSDETMGHGATMTFKSTTTGFKDEQVKELMKAIRIVFFDPSNSALPVLATAKLDVTNAVYTTDGWQAKMYLYKLTKAGEVTYKAVSSEGITDATAYFVQYDKYTQLEDAAAATYGSQLYISDGADGYTEATYAADSGKTYFKKEVDYKAAEAADLGKEQLYAKETSVDGETKLTGKDAVITALTQNTAQAVSVLVYLDGATITNASVAATAATSVTGTMNLQFASSANLVPMEYTELMNQGASVKPGNLPAGVAINSTSKTDGTEDYVFTVTGTDSAKAYTVSYTKNGGSSVQLTADTDSKYTVPKSEITGKIVISVTEVTGG